jgi:HAD superfamily hydrolase (TIGR01509 family)
MNNGLLPALVIFDCDGVLVESEAIANRVFAEMVSKAGYPLTAEDSLRRFKGGRFKSLQAVIEEQLGRSLGSDWIAKLYAAMYVAFRQELQPVAGVVELIATIQARRIPICVASNGPLEKMRVTLGITGLWDLFNGHIFSSDMVDQPKPAPDLFLLAARTLGVAPADCLVIEDSRPGILGGLAAGMPTAALVAEPHEKPAIEALGPTYLVPSLDQISQWFRAEAGSLCP